VHKVERQSASLSGSESAARLDDNDMTSQLNNCKAAGVDTIACNAQIDLVL
jgi:hypothetical protein